MILTQNYKFAKFGPKTEIFSISVLLVSLLFTVNIFQTFF